MRFFYKSFLMLTFLLSFFLIQIGLGQNVTRKMNIQAGTQLGFVFNRFDNFDTGITKSDYTRINVYYNDENTIPEGWKLKVKADAVNLSSFFGSQTIPAGVIKLDVNDSHGNVETIYLSDTYQEIAAWSAIMGYTSSSVDILISYQCGPDADLSNATNGYYVINLDFLLEK